MKRLLAGATLVAWMAFCHFANATVVNPSGGDDTVAMQKVCTAGQILELVRGTYHTKGITCASVVGKSNPDVYFWYEGQKDTTAIVGTGVGGSVISCPAPGPCAYSEIGVEPSNGQSGIGATGTVHTMRLTNVTVMDTSATSGACVDFSQANNQSLTIQGGVFQHCGGYCVDASQMSDSSIIGATISNCQKGGIHVDVGFGNRIIGNYIEDMYTVNGIEYWGGGKFSINDNQFDLNNVDIDIGGGTYGVITGNISCRAYLAFIEIDNGGSWANAAGNNACWNTAPPGFANGNAYYAVPGTWTWGAIYDPAPSYVDQNSQNIIAPFVH